MSLPAFPPASWAWPRGTHHLLLMAVLHGDDSVALAAARNWLSRNDIDEAGFREHRLLAAMAQRFGDQLADHPAFPRLAGLSRHLWARAQMAQRQTMPAVAMLAAAMPVMLLKGASRAALDPRASKGRIGHDIDVLVPPGRLGEAMDLLLAAGWAPDQQSSAQLLRAQAGWLRAVNLHSGTLGDIDLHQRAYRALHQDAADDLALWRRSVPVRFGGLDLSVPSAADRAAIAIVHGTPEGHAHSDWLVDTAIALNDPQFDYAVLDDILARRELDVLAEPCLAYLAEAAGLPVPSTLIRQVAGRACRRPLRRLAALALARPAQQQEGAAIRLLKPLLRQPCRRLTRDLPPPAGAGGRIRIHGRRVGRYSTEVSAEAPPLGSSARIAPRPAGRLRLILRVPFAGPSRRAEFELNAPHRHVARLSYRNRRACAHMAELLFEITLPEEAANQPLTLTARPLGARGQVDDVATRARFAPIPFALMRQDTHRE